MQKHPLIIFCEFFHACRTYQNNYKVFKACRTYEIILTGFFFWYGNILLNEHFPNDFHRISVVPSPSIIIISFNFF